MSLRNTTFYIYFSVTCSRNNCPARPDTVRALVSLPVYHSLYLSLLPNMRVHTHVRQTHPPTFVKRPNSSNAHTRRCVERWVHECSERTHALHQCVQVICIRCDLQIKGSIKKRNSIVLIVAPKEHFLALVAVVVRSGTQFTCFTDTKAQILTQKVWLSGW